MMLELTAEQRAIIDLTTSPDAPPLACLTGGPGTGKTTTLRELLAAAGAAGLRSSCAAPSGKAAQRMEEATGRPASTLHRLMRLLPGGSDWSPILADLLVVDEASMVDVPLMASALEAAQAGGVRTVLLVGDADQLPPVGPGQPFHDLLAGTVCPTVRLTTVHRQAQESGIVRAAHAIVRGEEPSTNDTDFILVAEPGLAQIPAAVWELIQRERLDIHATQVLCPQRNTTGGVEAICLHVEASRDAEGGLVRGMYRGGTKVINTKNDYNLEVYNGELGRVVHAVDGGRRRAHDELVVQIAGGTKRYRGGAIAGLRPAWALSVHKSQGSQWDDVIVVAHTAHAYMLTRRLLYVAVTRGARRVWVVGQQEALRKAVRNTRDARRNTWLSRRFARDLARAEASALDVSSTKREGERCGQ